MTESAGIGARGLNTEKIRNYTSIGLLAPNTQAKVVDWNTGSSLPPGSTGELWLRGPGIMKGNMLHQFPQLFLVLKLCTVLSMLICIL